jgi:uncharacterized membrane protein
MAVLNAAAVLLDQQACSVTTAVNALANLRPAESHARNATRDTMGYQRKLVKVNLIVIGLIQGF